MIKLGLNMNDDEVFGGDENPPPLEEVEVSLNSVPCSLFRVVHQLISSKPRMQRKKNCDQLEEKWRSKRDSCWCASADAKKWQHLLKNHNQNCIAITCRMFADGHEDRWLWGMHSLLRANFETNFPALQRVFHRFVEFVAHGGRHDPLHSCQTPFRPSPDHWCDYVVRIRIDRSIEHFNNSMSSISLHASFVGFNMYDLQTGSLSDFQEIAFAQLSPDVLRWIWDVIGKCLRVDRYA